MVAASTVREQRQNESNENLYQLTEWNEQYAMSNERKNNKCEERTYKGR